MKIEEMSDYEVNLAVLKFLCRGQLIKYHKQEFDELLDLGGFDGGATRVVYTTGRGSVLSFDGANKIQDAWYLIYKYHVSIEMPHPDLGNRGTVTIYNPKGTDYHVDFDQDWRATRAIMDCVLKMIKDKTDV